jgi:copper transport protein
MRDDRHHRGSAVARAASWVLLASLLLLVPAHRAAGHALLLRSDPADGAVLPESPPRVLLWFAEAISPELSDARLVDGENRPIGGTKLRIDPDRPDLAILALPELPPGVYGVAWDVFSEEDAHAVEGLVVFRVGAGPAPAGAGPAESAPSALEAALRGLDLASLLLLVGALAVTAWVVRPMALVGASAEALHRSRGRLLGLGAAAAGAAALVGIALLARRVGTVGRSGGLDLGERLGAILGTAWGRLWLAREGHLLALGAVLAIAARRERTGREPGGDRGGALLLLAAAILIVSLARVHVLAGHAASAGGLAVPAGIVHLLAAGTWVGGLVAILIARPDGGLAPPVARSVRAACLRRFGTLALMGAGLLAATGLYAAGRQVASVDALIATVYGRAVLGKTALFLVVGSLGLANALLLHPRAAEAVGRRLRRPSGWTPVGRRRLGRLVLIEVCVALVAVGTAALLGAVAPARGSAFEPARASSPPIATAEVDDLVVTVSVRPNRPGPNVFEVLVAETTRPPLAEVREVRLRFVAADGRVRTSPPLVRVEPGRFRLGGDELDAAGDWRIEVVVERPGLPTAVTGFGWTLGAAAGHRIIVSDAPLGPALTVAAAVALGALALVLIVWLALRRRPTVPDRPGRLDAVPLGAVRDLEGVP